MDKKTPILTIVDGDPFVLGPHGYFFKLFCLESKNGNNWFLIFMGLFNFMGESQIGICLPESLNSESVSVQLFKLLCLTLLHCLCPEGYEAFASELGYSPDYLSDP